jgi:hypothetical protein
LFELAVAASLKSATRRAFFDEQLGEKFAKPTLYSDSAPDAAKFGVNRLTLREILLARLDAIVHFGRPSSATSMSPMAVCGRTSPTAPR